MNIKKGDNVLVIAGKDKGKTGKVLETNPKHGKVTVENVNIVTKHQKPKSQQDKGGIIKKTAPMEASNVMIICPNCGKATRISHKEVDGKHVRACKKCGASLDKEFVKTLKKEAKKAEKTAKKAENSTVNAENAPKAPAAKPAAKATPKPAAKAAAKTKKAPSAKQPAAKKASTTAAKTAPKKSKTTTEAK